MTASIILASGSPFRAALLGNAGIEFTAVAPDIDERAVEAALHGSNTRPDDVALVLAEAKAVAVSEKHSAAAVIGCDQVLSLDGDILHKCETMEEARKRLLQLSGKTHQLNSAAVVARNGETLWRHVDICHMTMRVLDPGFIGRHLATAGEAVLKSVGVYQYEGVGIQLFDKIDSDYFSIVGLPLLAVLKQLREMKAIDG